jgi:hypothetical protein
VHFKSGLYPRLKDLLPTAGTRITVLPYGKNNSQASDGRRIRNQPEDRREVESGNSSSSVEERDRAAGRWQSAPQERFVQSKTLSEVTHYRNTICA